MGQLLLAVSCPFKKVSRAEKLGEEVRMEVKNHGLVEGGNGRARFFLHIHPPISMSRRGFQKHFKSWDDKFQLVGSFWESAMYPRNNSWVYSISTRQEFTKIPAIIVEAVDKGYDVSTSMWYVEFGQNGLARLSSMPSDFWKAYALAQAYVEE